MFTTKVLVSTDKKIRLIVGLMEDGFIENPREYDDMVEFTTREHRHYNLPKEFNFDWDAYDEWDMEEIEEMDKNYHIFFLDCYEHSGMKWSLAWEWMQCRFDTAKRVGLMRVRKDKVGDRNDALNLVKDAIDLYNKRLNGEIYEWRLERLVTRKSEDGREKTEWEFLDGCSWFYDEDEALSDGKAIWENVEFLDEDWEK